MLSVLKFNRKFEYKFDQKKIDRANRQVIDAVNGDPPKNPHDPSILDPA